MNKIFYFNINYQCNNACRFCFSHNVDTGRANLEFSEFCKALEYSKADNTDLIVLNGGEPTLHPQFTDFIEYIQKASLNCNIYSNGTLINSTTYPYASKFNTFIIPIHGNEDVHNYIAGRKGAFQDTLASLEYLQSTHSRYSLKFIITNEMANSQFSIKDFIYHHQLNPESIHIARVNETLKSRKNDYRITSLVQTRKFILQSNTELRNSFQIKYIDIPACLLPISNALNTFVPTWDFYFQDVDIRVQKREYYKERLNTIDCNNCVYSKSCDLLSRSYYVIGKGLNGNYSLIVE